MPSMNHRGRGGRPAHRVALLGAVVALSVVGLVSPARAAEPDRMGFVLFNGATTVAAGTTPAATTVVAGPPGRFTITFPGLGIAGGVVHVTAINPSPHWCQVDTWGISGADEKVFVSCYKPGGGLDPSPFTAIFERSSGVSTRPGRFGYVDSTGTGAIISQYNSAGAVNGVAHLAAGRFQVKLPGLSTPGPVDGGVQVTAVGPNVGARCKVESWTSGAPGQSIIVTCWNAAGAPFDNRFTLSYQYQRSLYAGALPPKYFGYVWNVPPIGPVSTDYNSIAGPGANTIVASGLGLSLATFPGLTVLPDNVSVTGFGVGSAFCGLTMIWGHSGGSLVIRDVNCFTNADGAVTSGSLVSANSAF